jgi:hypothetical protein
MLFGSPFFDKRNRIWTRPHCRHVLVANGRRPDRLAEGRGRGAHQKKGRLMLKCLGVTFLLALTLTGAKALDLNELAPCKPAAMRFCDRSGGLTMTNLLRCGAILAGVSHRVGGGCRDVLRRYGQISGAPTRHDNGTMNASLH